MSLSQFELPTSRVITQLQERAINGDGSLDSNALSDLHVDCGNIMEARAGTLLATVAT
jgi:hypothetical protein